MHEKANPRPRIKVLTDERFGKSIGIGLEDAHLKPEQPIALTFSNEFATDFIKCWNCHDELLEACIGLIGILTPEQYDRKFPNIYKKAKAAIKKAEAE